MKRLKIDKVDLAAIVRFRDGSYGFLPCEERPNKISEDEVLFQENYIAGVFLYFLNHQLDNTKEAKMAKKALGQTVRKLREEVDMSQTDLIKQVEVVSDGKHSICVPNLSELENGKTFPQYKRIKYIADALQKTLQDLLKIATDKYWDLL